MSLRRVAAALALVLLLLVVVVTIVTLAGDLPRLLAQLALFAVVLLAGWVTVTRSGWKRVVAAIVAVVAVVAVVLLQVGDDDLDGLSLGLRIAALIVATGLARYAIGTTTQALQAAETPGTPVPPAANGVLFMNLKSGGGKAERFHLVDECRARGIEPVVLEGGQDWVAIIRETAPKHDVVGMAGGTDRRRSWGASLRRWGFRWWSCPPARGTTSRSTWAWTVTTSSARSTPTARRSNGRWISPT